MINNNNKKAFTLVELIVVVIIIGIIASIAAPMMLGITDKAIKTEAITALGTIREAEREYYVEHGIYVTTDAKDMYRSLGSVTPEALNGTYFSEECYFVLAKENIWAIWCFPSRSTGVPGAAKVRNYQNITMGGNGNINLSVSTPTLNAILHAYNSQTDDASVDLNRDGWVNGSDLNIYLSDSGYF